MTCDLVLRSLPLYFYGELPPDEEEALEQHLHTCVACSRELERQRAMAAAFDRSQAEVPASLLAECRADLMAAIDRGVAPAAHVPAPTMSPWKLFLAAMAHTFSGMGSFRQPVGALALLAIGFFGARWVQTGGPTLTQQASMIPSPQVFDTVRAVQPDNGGGIQITFDETHRHMISGKMDDPNIQRLLLAASREENAAVRVESVDVLKNRATSTMAVRDALLNAVAHDPNAEVRRMAVEGLKPLAGDADVRKVLSQVLLADDNPAIRMEVVDMLVEHRDADIVGVLEDLMQKESNSYVRLKSEQALKAMNASIGTF